MRIPTTGRIALAGLAALLLAGCGGGGFGGPGADLMKAGRYDEAVAALETAVAQKPGDARLIRNLGIARFEAGNPKGAVDALHASLDMTPGDPIALFFLGRAEEGLEAWADAGAAYTRYLEKKPDDPEVRTRLRAVNLRRIHAEIEDAVRNEAQRGGRTSENTLAVTAFRNLSNAEELEALGKGLQAMITGDLAQVKRFTVLERERLNVLMDEVKLGTSTVAVKPEPPQHPLDSVSGVKERLARLSNASGTPYYPGAIDDAEDAAYAAAVRAFQSDQGLAADGKVGPKTRAALDQAFAAWMTTGTIDVPAMDPSSVPRAGRLLGAGLLVTGTLSGSPSDALRIDAGITESATGELKGPGADAEGPLADVLRLEKRIVFGLIDGLDITLTGAERDAIGRLPTGNVNAFLAWSEGLMFEDRGRMDLARGAYARALNLDPGFAAARRSLGSISGTEAGFSQRESRLAGDAMADGGAVGGSGALRDRLDLIGAINGRGLAPGRSGNDQEDPGVTPVGATGGTATIIVTGEVPR